MTMSSFVCCYYYLLRASQHRFVEFRPSSSTTVVYQSTWAAAYCHSGSFGREPMQLQHSSCSHHSIIVKLKVWNDAKIEVALAIGEVGSR